MQQKKWIQKNMKEYDKKKRSRKRSKLHMINIKGKGKGKVIPLQARCGPEGV